MKRWDVIAAVGLLLPPSAAIGLHMYIGSFNRMLGDDYCSLYIAQRLGLLRSIWHWYRSWHGGFSASAADWAISFWGPRAFPLHTFVFLSTWLVFTILAARNALRLRGYTVSLPVVTLLLAVLLVFTTLCLSPDIIESLFWWGGARGYLSPLILFTLYVALYFHFESDTVDRFPIGIWGLLSFGLAFFIGGFSETFTPVFVVLLAAMATFIGWHFRFSTKQGSMFFLTAGFVGALLSLLVMVFAPGNSIRQTYFPVSPDLFTILEVSIASFFAYLYAILSSPVQLTALLGSALGSVWLGMRMSRVSNVAPPHAWWLFVVLLIGFVLAFGCFPPAVYGTSEPPPERTLIVPSFLLVACVLTSGFGFGERLVASIRKGLVFSPALLIIALGFILFSAYTSTQELYSMRDEHISFAQQWDQVDIQIRTAKASGRSEVHIPSLKNWAEAEYPTDNPRYWPNICYSKFYDINVIAPPR